MTRETVLLALREGIPFEVRMADGRSYLVPDQTQIAVGPSSLVILDEAGLPHVLPLLTVTGISYLAPGSSPQAA